MSQPEEELRSFLAALWPEIGDRWMLFWGAPSKRSYWVQRVVPATLTMLAKWATEDNVYVGCALRGANLGATLRGERSECQAIPGLWLDLDYGTAHKKKNLPTTEEEAMALLAEMGPAPSAVIHSGRGLQAWWLFREPWIFETDADRTEAESLTMAWCRTLRAKAKGHGWDADQVGDLPRVMRLPGLWNRKGVAVRTRLVSLTEDRYDPSELTAFLVEGTEKEAELPSITWAFTMPIDAEPPAEKFHMLCEIDLSFKRSWDRMRSDLQDQSGSSYDLSLATRALTANWTAQEVVNLLIASRRKHGDDLKLRKDYYERTLTRAMSGKGEETRRQMVEDLKAGKALPDASSDDPADNFAVISKWLGDGVSITKIVRYRSDVNTYQLTVNGRTINVPSIKEFDSQTEFRRLILDHSDVRINSFKGPEWQTFLTRLFRDIINVDVMSASNRGAFEDWIEIYLTSSQNAIQHEDKWQEAALLGNPFRLNGGIYITTQGFLRFITSQMHEKMTNKNLKFTLTQLGYTHEQKNVRGKGGTNTSRSIWRVR